MTTLSFNQKRFPHMTEEILKQILIVRDTGLTNMFALNDVSEIATSMECDNLAQFVDDYPREYVDFILNGE